MSYAAVVIRMLMNFKRARQTVQIVLKPKVEIQNMFTLHTYDGFDDNVQKQMTEMWGDSIKI